VHGLLHIRLSGLGVWLLVPALMWVHTVSFLAQTSANPFQGGNGVGQQSPPRLGPALHPLSPEEQGDLMMARRSYTAAIRAYQHAPLTSPVVWNKIGVAYHHLFAFDEARKAYQTALTIDPRYADALNNLAAVYHAQHEYKRAEHTYKRALKYAPNAAVTYYNLGTAYFAQEKYKQGMKAYRQALAIDPNVLDSGQLGVEEQSSRQQLVATNYYLAKTYAAAGKTSQALSYLRKAFDEGFNDRKRLMEDKEFSVLRSTPEFHQLMVEQHLD
jgi:tetratricopeptide (TPR) repeat protein